MVQMSVEFTIIVIPNEPHPRDITYQITSKIFIVKVLRLKKAGLTPAPRIYEMR